MSKAQSTVGLIGAILTSVIWGLVGLGLFWTIIALPLVGGIIAMEWVAYNKAKKSKGWAIYQIVHGVLFNWVTAAAGIIGVIHHNKQED